ncbi:MAG: hypothetical protein KDC39_02550 [Actinobacteria bacterium]|nr:hypothetical protein [Actinomycetota bacterium]
MGMNRAGRFLVSAALAGGLLAGGAVFTATAAEAAPPVVSAKYKSNGGFKVRPKNFGQHSYEVAPGTHSGALRFFAPMWRDMEPTRGSYNWTQLDTYVTWAEAWGYNDVLFTFRGTPQWAAGPVPYPTKEVSGVGSTSAPTSMKYWKQFVKAVVTRYKGRITQYQAWNEVTSPQFYQGSAGKMAKMTQILYKMVQKYDRKAVVVGASVQTHVVDAFRSFTPKYLSGLRKKGWPVEALAGHFYPAGSGGPNQRLRQIDMFNSTLNRAGVPKRVNRMDTEVNYSLGGAGATCSGNGRIGGNKAAMYVARTYLDGWRRGIRQQYWYLWTTECKDFPGIQMYATHQPGVKSYNRLAKWTTKAKFKGCSTGNLVKCKFVKKGSKFQIMFTEQGKSDASVGGKKQMCSVKGGRCKTVSGKVRVTKMPVRIS